MNGSQKACRMGRQRQESIQVKIQRKLFKTGFICEDLVQIKARTSCQGKRYYYEASIQKDSYIQGKLVPKPCMV